LWLHHPTRPAGGITEVVSTRDLFLLISQVAAEGSLNDTILEEGYRQRHAVAFAEHFFYPHLKDMLPQYRQNIRATISAQSKIIVREDGSEVFDLHGDPEEMSPDTSGDDPQAVSFVTQTELH
jgi:hypothetical protein